MSSSPPLSRARAGSGTYRGTVVAVTHDRCFLESVAGWILEVDGGRLLPHKGNYTSWLRERIWSKGSLLPTDELVQRATGETLNAAHFRRHLEARYAK